MKISISCWASKALGIAVLVLGVAFVSNFAVAQTTLTPAAPASSAKAPAWAAPDTFVLYGVPITVLIGALIAVASIRKAVGNTPWSLADALSEETQLTSFKDVEETKPDGTKLRYREILKDKEDKPVLVTELRASSSRVIAFMGMFVILFLFVGFGVFVLFSFGSTGAMPESTDRIVHFLLAGLTLFAPYLVNKFASVFQGLSGGK